MNKNSLLAIILSFLFLVFWWGVVYKPAPNYPKSAPPATSSQTELAKTSAEPAKDIPLTEPELNRQNTKFKDISINADNARIVISAEDSGIKTFIPAVKNQFNLVANDINIFSTDGIVDKITTKEREVKIQQRSKNILIEKIYNFQLSSNRRQNVQIRFVNTGPDAAKIGPIYLTKGINTDEKDPRENLALTRVNALIDTGSGYLIKLKNGSFPLANYRWVAVNNRYFTLTFIPEDGANEFLINIEQPNKKAPPVVYLTTQKPLPPGQTLKLKFNFYFGPKIYTQLKGQGDHLEKVVDFGLFGFLGKWSLWLLNGIYHLVGNYGWTIVLFTIILQILVLPLTKKSLQATLAMKAIQPQMQLIQKQYRNDPKRLNTELMNLYRQHNINPLGGCLPMLLQLPIFWALFTTLRNAYELRGAHWILWIKDLSAHDPYYILPIFMGLLMLVQQLSAGAAADPTQKQMAYLMPILFTFLFAKFPSGLVLYWTVNSLLTLILQLILTRKKAPEVVAVISQEEKNGRN